MTLLVAARQPCPGAPGLSRRVVSRSGWPFPSAVGWLGGLTALTLAVGGCGGQSAVTLPHKATAPAPAAASPATLAGGPVSAHDQVVAAYTGYWQALGQALDTQDAARARAILARYVVPALIPSLISGFETDWARGEIQYGGPVPHITSVRVTGGRAAVHDCADFSNAGAQSASTGQVIGSLGNPRVNMISTLVLSRGRWLVSDQVPVVLSCVP
jgi:hypothetical protein